MAFRIIRLKYYVLNKKFKRYYLIRMERIYNT